VQEGFITREMSGGVAECPPKKKVKQRNGKGGLEEGSTKKQRYSAGDKKSYGSCKELPMTLPVPNRDRRGK